MPQKSPNHNIVPLDDLPSDRLHAAMTLLRTLRGWRPSPFFGVRPSSPLATAVLDLQASGLVSVNQISSTPALISYEIVSRKKRRAA